MVSSFSVKRLTDDKSYTDNASNSYGETGITFVLAKTITTNPKR